MSRSLPAAIGLLPAPCSLLPDASCLLPDARCPLPAASRRYFSSELEKCDSCTGTTSSRMCCSTAAGLPIASTSRMIDLG